MIDPSAPRRAVTAAPHDQPPKARVPFAHARTDPRTSQRPARHPLDAVAMEAMVWGAGRRTCSCTGGCNSRSDSSCSRRRRADKSAPAGRRRSSSGHPPGGACHPAGPCRGFSSCAAPSSPSSRAMSVCRRGGGPGSRAARGDGRGRGTGRRSGSAPSSFPRMVVVTDHLSAHSRRRAGLMRARQNDSYPPFGRRLPRRGRLRPGTAAGTPCLRLTGGRTGTS